MSRRFRIPALLLVLACAGTLAGCGVKGPLEPPGGTKTGTTQTGAAQPAAAGTPAASTAAAAPVTPAAEPSPTAWAEQSDAGRSTSTSSANSSAPTPTVATTTTNTTRSTTGSASGGAKGSITSAPVSLDKIQRPDRPFILDGLL
ncbi:putative lipoprotein [Azorhizobium sp. AG788]|uniref:LPS translocon maturation chaperone LptM n=1 Tax=Azorhizobium sp. AG788 TaxID=2183897 RepID=UPI00105F159B|nr:lipoprotein [Azorhizobium sp. AG788]TDT91370.1 putative lipoprotein [Azorhizobium sp. AG788]